MKFERPMLLLYAHRTHGPEVWESERVGKYPGVTRRSKVMFILGEVLDPLQQLPLNAPMYEEDKSIDDRIVGGHTQPWFMMTGSLEASCRTCRLKTSCRWRTPLLSFHLHCIVVHFWTCNIGLHTQEHTGIRLSVNDEEDRTDVETSEDKTMLKRQKKLDEIEIEQVGRNSLPIRDEREIFHKLMSWPAQDEKALVDYTKVRHEGGEKSAMFGFRYHPKAYDNAKTVYGLTALKHARV